MAISERQLGNLFSKTKTAEDFAAKLQTPEGRAALLQPLSNAAAGNALTYAVRGYFESRYDDKYRPGFVAAVLDALEKAEPDAGKRAEILTSANGLGQSAFLAAMRYDGDAPVFDLLTEKLEQWAGADAKAQFVSTLLSTRLGAIDHDISYALQDVRRIREFGTAEYAIIDRLTTDSYKPATLEALKAAVDEARPLVREWAEKNPPKTGDSYGAKKHAGLLAFANDANAVKDAGTLVLQAFPGAMFTRLLEMQQQLAPQDAATRAEGIFNLLATPQDKGKTAMHATWQNSLVLGPPSSAGMVTDSLGPFIAGLDRMLGTDTALPLVAKLLQLEDGKGQLPLDNFQYNDLPRRDYYVESFLTSLRKELGSKEKFTQYVKEVVAAVLPADYRIAMNAYEPAEINEATGQPKPRRGASLDF